MPDAKKRTAKKKKKYRPMQKFVSVFLFLFACFFTYSYFLGRALYILGGL